MVSLVYALALSESRFKAHDLGFAFISLQGLGVSVVSLTCAL